MSLPALPERKPGFQTRLRTRIRTKLTVSHVLVVTLSLFVFSALMAILYFWILGMQGIDLAMQVRSAILLTIFVTFVIGVITVCSIAVAALASWYVSRRLTRQISELEEATIAIAEGHLENRVAVLTSDELGRLAVRFNLLAERLQELDRQRRDFVASISHDLRTPIAIIRGHTDAQLREPDGETPLPAEAFRAIEHEVVTLGKLVDDLFTLSRLEEAALPVAVQAVDLGGLVEDAVRGIRPYALKVSRVSVNAVAPDGIPPVAGDPTRLTQIVNNLLHNAIRHTPEGGVVVAEVAPGAEAGSVVLTVRDTGVGVAPEDLPHIFDRFYQGESVRSGGAGLGLSIVKQLVEIQGGTVAAASTPGEGTVISVVLRAAAPGAAATR